MIIATYIMKFPKAFDIICKGVRQMSVQTMESMVKWVIPRCKACLPMWDILHITARQNFVSILVSPINNMWRNVDLRRLCVYLWLLMTRSLTLRFIAVIHHRRLYQGLSQKYTSVHPLNTADNTTDNSILSALNLCLRSIL